ncbi:MAG: hypothetical protein Q8K75_09570 [Chlamydiales bacterium]|nr:hypothetical protein [Chlamydiales bacterium]
MYVVVPLAGPDCYDAKYGIRPMMPMGESTLIHSVLSSRWNDVSYVFVLREHENMPRLRQYLRDTFVGCQIVVVSQLAAGAAFSALAGMSLVPDNVPVVVDLADIAFEGNCDFKAAFAADEQLQGIVPYFESSEPQYSYLQLDEEGYLLQAVEKKVISNHATAGVYAFRNVGAYLQALARCVRDGDTYKGLYFVCPLLNDMCVTGVPVTVTEQHSLAFH